MRVRDELGPDNLLEDPGDIENGLREDRGALEQAREPAAPVAEYVKERIDDQVAIFCPKTHRIDPAGRRSERLRVGRHHALGKTGGPRREQDVAEVVRLDRLGNLVIERTDRR